MARTDAARALRRDRRHRHERHRRAAGESRLPRQRIGRAAIGDHRSAGRAGRARSRSGTTRGHVGDADVVVVSSAIARGQPGGRRGARAARAGHSARRDARRADAAARRHRHRRRARQDDDDVDGGADAGAGRPRSDGGHRRPAQRVRQQRAARAAGSTWWSEADESDRSFLKLSPTIAVVTNIDREHMEAYGSFDRLVDAFVDFADRVPFYGAVVACVDDRAGRGDAAAAHAARRSPMGSPRAPTCAASDPSTDGAVRPLPRALSRARRAGRRPARASSTLAVPGRHNLLNALAAVAVGLELGRAVRSHRRGARGVPRRRAALPDARRERRRHRRRRLRPSSDGNRRRAARGARRAARRGSSPCFSRTATRARAICSTSSVPRSRWPTSSC